MSSTTLIIIICFACVCFHLRKLREIMDSKKDSSNSGLSNYTQSKFKFKKPIKLKLKNIRH